jgi:hypothetical protein
MDRPPLEVALRQLCGQEPERHAAAELAILGLVHHAHAAATQFFQDAIVGSNLAAHEAMAPPENAGDAWLASVCAGKPTPLGRLYSGKWGDGMGGPPAMAETRGNGSAAYRQGFL